MEVCLPRWRFFLCQALAASGVMLFLDLLLEPTLNRGHAVDALLTGFLLVGFLDYVFLRWKEA